MEATALNQKTILLVDDEQDLLFILSKQLAAAGFNMLSTDNGEDAIALAHANHPDLIILDMVMPEQRGDEIGAQLKGDACTRDIPIIFLTALLSKHEERENGTKIGGQTVIAKPYDIDVLVEEIQRQVGEE